MGQNPSGWTVGRMSHRVQGGMGQMTRGSFSSPVSPIAKQDKAAAGKFRDNGFE